MNLQGKYESWIYPTPKTFLQPQGFYSHETSVEFLPTGSLHFQMAYWVSLLEQISTLFVRTPKSHPRTFLFLFSVRTAVVKDIYHNFCNELPKSVWHLPLWLWFLGGGKKRVLVHMLGMLVEIYVVLHFTVGGLWWFMSNYVCRLFMSTSLRYIKIFKLDQGHSHHMLRCTTWSPCCQWHDHMTLAWCQRHQKNTCPVPKRVQPEGCHRNRHTGENW